MGLNISGMILGYPVTGSIVSRIIVGLFMMIGVMVAGLVFVLAGSAAGWIVGSLLSTLTGRAGNDDSDSDEKVDV